MKANEFVKRFGWEYAKERMEYCKGARLVGMEIDLKRIVESHRLIEVEGGIDQVKDTFSFAYKHGADELTEYGKRLKQAIFDVESCQ